MSLKLKWNKFWGRCYLSCYYFPDYFGKHCCKLNKDILTPDRAICEFYDCKKTITIKEGD